MPNRSSGGEGADLGLLSFVARVVLLAFGAHVEQVALLRDHLSTHKQQHNPNISHKAIAASHLVEATHLVVKEEPLAAGQRGLNVGDVVPVVRRNTLRVDCTESK